MARLSEASQNKQASNVSRMRDEARHDDNYSSALSARWTGPASGNRGTSSCKVGSNAAEWLSSGRASHRTESWQLSGEYKQPCVLSVIVRIDDPTGDEAAKLLQLTSPSTRLGPREALTERTHVCPTLTACLHETLEAKGGKL